MCLLYGASYYAYLHYARLTRALPAPVVSQAGADPCTTAQFYIPAASPEQLPGNWRDRLAAAVAEKWVARGCAVSPCVVVCALFTEHEPALLLCVLRLD